MKDKFIAISVATIILLCGWVSYELFLSRKAVQNAEVIEVINPQVNTEILNGLTNKFYL